MSRRKYDEEKFDGRKFLSGLNLLNPVAWAKTVIYTFRALLIIGVVVGLIFGIGYWGG